MSLPAATIERFLALVAHHQANLWNAATVARALGDKIRVVPLSSLLEATTVADLGCLSSTFGNSAPKTKTLVNRLLRGVYKVSARPQSSAPMDDRGPVVRTIETAQTFLTAAEVDQLVGDYLGGMSVKSLAERYGIHRATVFSHLRRRNVPARRPGLCLDEKAEAVRLARAGVSMRAIARRMGVDRKGVRLALVEAGLIVNDTCELS